LPRTLRFSLLLFNECSLFVELRLAFVFCLDFCSYLIISLHQGVFGPLIYIGIHQKSCFKKVWMVLEKRKSFMQKSGTKRSLFRLRFRLLHAMLDVVLIVFLVIFCCSMTCLKWLRLLNEPLKKIMHCSYYVEAFIWFSPLMLYFGWLGACLQYVWLLLTRV
jgi:hypothetical protein